MSEKQTQSERFTSMVIKEFTANSNGVQITDFKKKLCTNYFFKLTQVLQNAETKRLAKDEKWRDQLALTWDNLDLTKLAVDVMAFCKVELDPTLPNQVSLIPYKNTANNKYDIVFMIGYKGCELKAKKYGLDVPDDVVVELVYSTDKFKQIKRDSNNRIEGYSFEVTNDFDRGKIIGGFYYYMYFDQPEKNRLRVLSLKDIEKRKPKHASTEFWGGQKEVWENGKKTGKFEDVDGWLDEMCYKTIYRAAYDAITIDSKKIDDALVKVLEKDKEAMYGTEEAEPTKKGIGFDKPIEVKSTTEKIESKEETPGF
jgi:recombination protein RecT